MNIPKNLLADRLEFMAHLLVLTANDTLVVHSGKRHINLKFADLEHYRGERARRGLKLPRGFQKVDSVALLKTSSSQLCHRCYCSSNCLAWFWIRLWCGSASASTLNTRPAGVREL